MVSTACGTLDISADWFAIIPSTVLVFTAEGSGCHIELTNTADACTEREEYLVPTVTDTKLSGERLGVTSCDPDACKFASDDEACVIGDRAEADYSFDYVRDGDSITITSTDDLCGTMPKIDVYDKQ